MSDIKYGLISATDAAVLEKTIDLICEASPNEIVNVTEIGLYSGQTSEALSKYIGLVKHRVFFYTGIDNGKDGEELKHFPDFNSRLILGNSNEVYNQIEDNSQHLIFVDGCHCFSHVVSDFFCYAPKVKAGGYLAFHDTGKHIKPFNDYQHGDKENPDAYISVRKALKSIGLVDYFYSYGEGGTPIPIKHYGWELIFDEADPENEAGGVCVFKKLY